MSKVSKLEIDILKLVEQMGLDHKKMLSYVFKENTMNVSNVSSK